MSDVETLVNELKEERLKFGSSDKSRMQEIIKALVAEGYYPSEPTPTMVINQCGILRMVEGYGVDWHQYRKPHACPECNTDLRNRESGPPFKREIGIYDRERDRTVSFRCPDCKKEWPR